MAEIPIDLSGQNAIVTGGAAGMGLAIAQRLARSGAGVCIWDLRQDAIDRIEAVGRLGSIQRDEGDVRVFGGAIEVNRHSSSVSSPRT